MVVNKEDQYTIERFNNAVGTKGTFLSNLWQLVSPIVVDDMQFWNSEGYYMAQRVPDLFTKKLIAKDSKISGSESRKARKRYPMDQDEIRRIGYMRNAIKRKFDSNPDLKLKLLDINEEIIEKNYWHDTFFGVDDKTLKGANILGKLLMEYRDQNQ